jgi:hypothetical protein
MPGFAVQFPEVLDMMCCLDDVSLADINALRKGLMFLARAVECIGDHPGPPLHTAIRECDLGGMVAFLVTKASEYERKAFGEVLSGLICGYVPVDFRPLTLSPRDFMRRRSIQVRATKLDIGVRVLHPTRGAGQLIDIDHAESRGKPYTVMYENGETHHCTPCCECVCATPRLLIFHAQCISLRCACAADSAESVLKLQRLGFNMNNQQEDALGGRMSTGLFGLVEKAHSILRRSPGHAEMGSTDDLERDLNRDDAESDLNGSTASRPKKAKVSNGLNGDDDDLLLLHGVYQAHEAEDDNGLLHLHHALAIFASRMSA